MSQKLWVAYETNKDINRVSIEECEYVDDFIQEIGKEFSISTHITLFHPDGITEIKPNATIKSLENTGNSRATPLVVKNVNIFISDTATFELYSWKATKKPFKVIKLHLDKGRIPLESLLLAEKITSLYLIDPDGNIYLLSDKDGFSIQKWVNGQTYKLRFDPSSYVDMKIPFSERDKEKMNIFLVQDDFGIKFDKDPWVFSGDSLEFPVVLTQTLALFAQFNSLRVEASRRAIVSLFLHYAISTIPEGNDQLWIDEDTPLAIVRNVDRNGEAMIVRYFGSVDFVIGHINPLSNMLKDAAVMVTETKNIDSFNVSLPQVLAQAAGLMFFRRGMKPPRGINGSGGPIVFIRTDGERWIFSKMAFEEGFPTVQHSSELNLDISKNSIVDETAQKIFDWIRYAITFGYNAASLGKFDQNVADDEDTVTAEFSSLTLE